MKKQIVVAALFTATLFGCVNQKKVTKWNDDHPQEAAAYAAKKFPCKDLDTTYMTSVDTAGFSQGIRDMIATIDFLNNENDSLIHQLISRDTTCRHYLPVVQRLRDSLAAVKNNVKNVKPVIITNTRLIRVLDSAYAVATGLKNIALQKKNDKLEKDLAAAKSSNKIRFWMLVSSGLLNSLLLFLLFKKKKFNLWKSFSKEKFTTKHPQRETSI